MQSKPFNTSAPRLIFAEDDPDWTSLFCLEFQKLAPGWDIICAAEGLSAVRALENAHMPRALLTDLRMQGMDGLELIEWVRAQPRFLSLPVFVSSTSENPLHRQRCTDLKVVRYLDKPATLQGIRDNIREIVQRCGNSSFPGLDGETGFSHSLP